MAKIRSNHWQPDILGDGFEQLTLPLGEDPDTHQPVVATLVRMTSPPPPKPGQPALLWIHGMSDYFFQDHVAEHFHEQGYPFYALDLRRCGRSRQRGERWHYTRDMSHYFPEITKAVQYVAQEHGQVVLLAHSTGGLIAPLWADEMRRNNPEVHDLIAGIILNSPWLDLQFPKALTTAFKPVINVLGRVVPLLPLPGGSLTAYGKSLHYEDHGSWSFNKQWKPISGHRKYFGWMRAVIQAQAKIHSGTINAGVPTLVLHSSHSFLKNEYTPAADTADTILDVDQISYWAPHVADDTTTVAIDGARHDVFLSEPYSRTAAYRASIQWLQTLTTPKE